MTDDNREEIIEQALRDGDEERAMELHLELLFESGRLSAMIEEARRRVDAEEDSKPSDNVIPLRHRRKERGKDYVKRL